MLLYCIISSISESSIVFFILHDCMTVTYITIFVIDIMLLLHIISYYTPLPKFKIMKNKINKKKRENKKSLSQSFTTLTSSFF